MSAADSLLPSADFDAVSGNRLAEIVRAKLNGGADGVGNQPPPNASAVSATEAAISEEVARLCSMLVQSFTEKVAAVRSDILRRRRSFELQAYEQVVLTADTGIRALLEDRKEGFSRLWFNALEQKRNYEFFKIKHELDEDPKTTAWPWMMFFLVGPLVGESMLNSVFFGEASDVGLVGGFLTAFMISAVNVAVGFLLGFWPLRFTRHLRKSHLVWAFPLLVFLMVALLAYNLAVGHYREMLIENPDAPVFPVLPRLLANPFGLVQIQSWILVAVGMVVATISAWKGYTGFGSYPGHGWAHRRMSDAADAVEKGRREIDANLGPTLEAFRQNLLAFEADCQTESTALAKDRAHLESLQAELRGELDRLKAARSQALQEYRDANMRVRTSAPPAYFSTPIRLDALDRLALPTVYDEAVDAMSDYGALLTNAPAYIQDKYEAQLQVIRGIDVGMHIQKVKAEGEAGARQRYVDEQARLKAIRAEYHQTQVQDANRSGGARG